MRALATKWGYYLLLRGVFNRREKVKLLNQDFSFYLLGGGNSNDFESLELVRSARALLKERESDQNHTFLSLLV